MADSEAVRSRRKRMHAAGDHSLCRRCAAVRGGGPVRPLVSLPPPAPGAKLDAPAEMQALAARLALVHEAEPANALIARELRMTLAELMPKGKAGADADLTGLFSALQA
jgi:hypothetical protein